MIPLKLQLKNFISYGSCQIIDFTQYHLICLTGKNGHGKSALLDAITWAIWGQARKVSGTSKPDEKLLRLGQSHMFVSIDFISNNQTYRVRREFTYQQGKSSSYLDFGIIQENGAFKALTDKTIRATQDKIDQAVGLSYDSFINSVFLRQGQSNEFSKKTPQERKEILASILGLQQYEELRKKSQEKTKILIAEKEQLQFSFKAAQSSIQELGNSPIELNNVLDQLRKQVEQLQAHQHILSSLQNEVLLIQEKCMCIKLTIEQSKKHAIEIEHLRTAIREKVMAWRQCNKQLLANNDSLIQVLQNELAQHNHAQASHSAANVALQQLTHQREMLQKELAQTLATQQLELQHTQQTYKIGLHQANQVFLELKFQLAQYEKTQSQLMSQNTTLSDEKKILDSKLINFEILKRNFEKRKEYYHTYNNKFSTYKAALEELKTQSKIINEGSAECPTCEQALAPEHTTHIHIKLRKKIQFLNHRINRFNLLLPQLKRITAQDYATIQNLQKIYEQRISLNERLQENCNKQEELKIKLTAIHQQMHVQLNEVNKAQSNYTLITEKKLPNINELYATHAELQKIENELIHQNNLVVTINYDINKHEICRKRLNELVLTTGYSSQDAIRIIQQERREQIRNLIKQLRVLLSTIENSNHIDHLKAIEDSLRLKQFEMLSIQQAMKTLQQEQESLMHQRGNLELRTTLLKTAEEAERTCSSKITALDDELTDYLLLQQAFSKEGIQALLIEHALPELEHEANNLLAKLTDNQSSLKIESLRDLKTGGTKETLDITISDAAGTRAYELFSGGEAFRIDFALRVALSKLLARRAGTTLQTLIIDEGFGSQDDEGLANIMEALHRIQDEFAKIIIVSHLPSMKEQFPVNFYVNKGADGSTIQIFQQG